MELKTFLSLVTKLKETPLPGFKSHLLLAPLDRNADLNNANYNNINPKRAAVLIHFYPSYNGQLSLVLIERNKYPGVHSGQISFPGGKYEDKDKDLFATALREANEEVAIQKSTVEYIRTLSKIFIPPSNFMVTPFLSYSSFCPDLIPERSEVSEIIEFPLNDLLEMRISLTRLINSSKNSVEIPCFKYNQKIIWGATAMILSELKIIIQNTLTK